MVAWTPVAGSSSDASRSRAYALQEELAECAKELKTVEGRGGDSGSFPSFGLNHRVNDKVRYGERTFLRRSSLAETVRMKSCWGMSQLDTAFAKASLLLFQIFLSPVQ